MLEAKTATAGRFNEGMQYYFDKDFTMAALAFQEVRRHHPGDATARIFLQKCGQFIGPTTGTAWR